MILRYGLLPSPGAPLPLLGHFHLLLARWLAVVTLDIDIFGMVFRGGAKDPVNRLWELYKQHSKDGLLWIRSLNLEVLYIGDFKTLKTVFNHPDVQGRTIPQTVQVIIV